LSTCFVARARLIAVSIKIFMTTPFIASVRGEVCITFYSEEVSLDRLEQLQESAMVCINVIHRLIHSDVIRIYALE